MSEPDDIKRQRALIAALSRDLEQRHGRAELFETHISWVLVAGGYAYKFKKAVHFDFVDFSTLRARRAYCEDEIRLNRRLAPDLYLDVYSVGGSTTYPLLGDKGEAIEYCVRMRAFPQEALWTYRLQHDLVSMQEVERLAADIARFHLAATRAPAHTRFGALDRIDETARDNFAQIGAATHGRDAQLACEIRAWGLQQQARLAPLFGERKRDGFVRECHGDLHSGNILTLDGRAQAFDCIEFNENLRWIDVIDDVAFTYMDLRFRGRYDLAARWMNAYLETGGDYEGVRVLRYYQVQRALVRCKVALLRMRQEAAGSAAARAFEREGMRYLEYAVHNSSAKQAAIMITHGFSGSGKSAFSRRVVECTGALQLRSDVERKRLHDKAIGASSEEAIGAGLYATQQTDTTYARLLALARLLVGEGMPVVVDAAFLQYARRREFRALASELGVPFVIFDVRASEATMVERIAARKMLGEDPSDAGVDVLQHQLHNHDPLSGDELAHVIEVDTEVGLNDIEVAALCERGGVAAGGPGAR